jgi:dCTP deaminase
MVMTDYSIRKFILSYRLIRPFIDYQYTKGVISYGLSSFGYDIRISNKFRIFSNCSDILDPKASSKIKYSDLVSDNIVVHPNSMLLCSSVEYISIPYNMFVFGFGKSTYARCGLLVNITPLEPGWSGTITLSLSNTTNTPIRLYANEGICQLIFIFNGSTPDVSYRDRLGKYMFQNNIVLPLIN